LARKEEKRSKDKKEQERHAEGEPVRGKRKIRGKYSAARSHRPHKQSGEKAKKSPASGTIKIKEREKMRKDQGPISLKKARGGRWLKNVRGASLSK